METTTPLPSWLLHPIARRHMEHLTRTRQAQYQLLAWRVQDSLADIGLIHQDYSIAGGRVVHIPEVITASAWPPANVVIRMLRARRTKTSQHVPARSRNTLA
jgi:hypothetical protein